MQKAELEEIIDCVLFEDIHEAPFSLIEDKIRPDYAEATDYSRHDTEALTRVAIAATLRRKYKVLCDENA